MAGFDFPATPPPPQIPSIGRIVQYRLSTSDVQAIERNRSFPFQGNPVVVGNIYAMLIVWVWGTTPEAAVNGKVELDGNDVLWVTSRVVGTQDGQYFWPPKI